jgi:hypothetical protein
MHPGFPAFRRAPVRKRFTEKPGDSLKTATALEVRVLSLEPVEGSSQEHGDLLSIRHVGRGRTRTVRCTRPFGAAYWGWNPTAPRTFVRSAMSYSSPKQVLSLTTDFVRFVHRRRVQRSGRRAGGCRISAVSQTWAGAGLEPTVYSPVVIAQQTGHVSMNTLAGYHRHAIALADQSPTAGLL